MADTKITDLDELTTVDASDPLAVVDDPTGAPVTKKATAVNIVKGGGGFTHTAAYASRPASTNDGNLFLPNDSYVTQRDTGAAWIPWGPIYPFVEPPAAGWSWVNQGTATLISANYGYTLSIPTGAASGVAARIRAEPTPPYVITAWILPLLPGINNAQCGIGWYQAGTTEMVIFSITYADRWEFSIYKNTNPTTFSANYVKIAVHDLVSPVCMRIEDDGSDRICSWSQDGLNFIELHSVGNTDFLTADNVFFYINNGGGTGYTHMNTLLSWREE